MCNKFSSSTIFKLPNGNKRSPDVAWIRKERWEALTEEEQIKFPPIAPDFAIELRTPTDSLSELRAKMLDYQSNGVRLGWLINPQDRQTEIYRIDRPVKIISFPALLNGEDVLPGFVLEF